jgi:RNA polymerase sigma factor (sigma-70 family)
MTGTTAEPGRPAPTGREGRLDFPHRAQKSRVVYRPPSRSAARGASGRSPVIFRPHDADPPEADQDPVADWVAQIQAGTDVQRNFERLYERFHPRLFAFFFRRHLARERCEELAQDALFQAFDKIDTFERRSRFSTWLWGIVRNLYINERRRMGTAKRDGVELPIEESLASEDTEGRKRGVVLKALEPDPYEEAERKEQIASLHQALATLPPKMQRCAILRFQHDLKYREIATVMRLNIDTVKAHLGQAKQLLRQRLGPRAGALIRREDEP